MKYLTTVLLLTTLLTGCAAILSNPSDIQHDFRKARWGNSQAHVATMEQGNTVYFRTPEQLIYKIVMDDVPVLLVYTFRNNKLRAAGYITHKPIKSPQNLVQKSITKHGLPDHELKNGMLWELPRSMIYVDGYHSYAHIPNKQYTKSPGALELILEELPDDTAQQRVRWDGVFTFIDKTFYSELADTVFPLSTLTYYEKRLFGVLRRRTSVKVRTLSGETIEIPVR